MRILRYIFSILFLIMTLGMGALSFFYATSSKPVNLRLPDPIGVVPFEAVFGAVAVVLLLITFMLFPKSRKKAKSVKDGKAKKGAPSAADAKKMLQKQRDDQSIKQIEEQQAEEQEVEDVSTYARLEDPKAMARLVVIDQGEMSREVVTELFREYFPELIKVVDHVREDDHTTLEVIGRHIIGIARNVLKMTDKSLSDNQFSIFQERNFKAEQEGILRAYLPDDQSGLNDVQKKHVGVMVDKRAWDSLQREVRGQRTDWKVVSLANAKDYI